MSVSAWPAQAANEPEDRAARQPLAAEPVIGGPVFNDPTVVAPGGPSARQAAVMDQLIGLTERVPAGGEIEFVMFEFAKGARSTAVLDALRAAYQRGVHVKVVLDSSSSDVLAELKKLFDAGSDRQSWAVGCPSGRGCIGRNYLHTKFALFSEVRTAAQTHRNVVFQTSSNLTDWYLYNSYNDAFTFSDAAVYQDFRTYFGDLRAMKQNPDYFWTSPTGSTYRGIFYPREQAAGKDPIVNVLKLVKCSYQDTDGVKRQTDIRIAMTKFNKNRVAIAQQLRALRDQGCWVDLVYPAKNEAGDESVDQTILGALKPSRRPSDPAEQPGERRKIQVTPCRFPVEGRKVTIHPKVTMIDGSYNGDITPRVYTGSANYTYLENSDDSAVRISGRTPHTAYLSWFWNLRDTCDARTPAGAG